MNWIEDPYLEAPDGHRWLRAEPEPCPDCACCSQRLCAAAQTKVGKVTHPGAFQGPGIYRGMPCSLLCRGSDHLTVIDCPCSSGPPVRIADLPQAA